MKNLKGATDTKVNFGAAKITLYSDVTMEEVQQAVAFKNYRIYTEKEEFRKTKEALWKIKSFIKIASSSAFLIIRFLLNYLLVRPILLLSVLCYSY